MNGFVVSGRSLKNYREKGVQVPPDCIILQCFVCGDSVTVSPEAAARLVEARDRGDQPVGALCTPCTVYVAAGPAGIAGVERSTHGAEVIGRVPEAREMYEFLKRRVKP
jgi:hypothetical protein